MLVDVIRMRHHGVRLSVEQLRRALPTRGTLQVMARPGHDRRGTRVIVATLLDRTQLNLPLLPLLEYARLTRAQDDAFVLFGFERVEVQVRQPMDYPQSWLCRLVSTAVSEADYEEEQLTGHFTNRGMDFAHAARLPVGGLHGRRSQAKRRSRPQQDQRQPRL